MLETLALSVLNYDSAVALGRGAHGLGRRGAPARRDGLATHRRAVRASRPREPPTSPGSARPATSRPDASWGIPTMGTAAHAFTLLFDSRGGRLPRAGRGDGRRARRCWSTPTTSRRRRDRGAGRRAPRSARCGSTRATSASSCAQVRAQLDALGRRRTPRITVTNDLDEYAIAALRSAPVELVRRRHLAGHRIRDRPPPAWSTSSSPTSTADRTAGWLPVGKKSDGKATVGGRKQPVRTLRDGVAVAEDIYVEDPPVDAAAGRPLLVDLVVDGEPGRRRTSAPPESPPRARTTPPRWPSCRRRRSRSRAASPRSRRGTCSPPALPRCPAPRSAPAPRSRAARPRAPLDADHRVAEFRQLPPVTDSRFRQHEAPRQRPSTRHEPARRARDRDSGCPYSSTVRRSPWSIRCR